MHRPKSPGYVLGQPIPNVAFGVELFFNPINEVKKFREKERVCIYGGPIVSLLILTPRSLFLSPPSSLGPKRSGDAVNSVTGSKL